MKGKKTFRKKEAAEIKKLIRQKLVADTDTQKRLRTRIRALGFYITDFSKKKGYTVADFEKLTRISTT